MIDIGEQPYSEPYYKEFKVEVIYTLNGEDITETVCLEFEAYGEDDYCGGLINVHAIDNGEVKDWFKQKGLDPVECDLDYQIL